MIKTTELAKEYAQENEGLRNAFVNHPCVEGIRENILKWAEFLNNKFGENGKFDEETICYLTVPVCQTKEEEKFVQDTLIAHGAIPLDRLEVGKTYIGECRNADEAVWLGDKFEYQRYEFGYRFPEEINHFQNDDGYDVFVPIKVKED
jgi:hypothetical protein